MFSFEAYKKMIGTVASVCFEKRFKASFLIDKHTIASMPRHIHVIYCCIMVRNVYAVALPFTNTCVAIGVLD